VVDADIVHERQCLVRRCTGAGRGPRVGMRCKEQSIDGEIGMFDKSPGIEVMLCSAGKVIVAISQTQNPQEVLLPSAAILPACMSLHHKPH
jgi:hypothetical protein